MLRLRRWLYVAALLGLNTLVGCQQHHFMTQADFEHYRDLALVPTATTAAETGEATIRGVPRGVDIRTVLSPEAPKREITLAECIAIALENGRTGEFFDRAGGRRNSLAGPQRGTPPSNLTDSLRVFAYDPAIAAVDVEQSLSKFDAFSQTLMSWNKVNRPIGDALSSFLAAGGIDAIRQDQAQFQSALLKPLPTGGLAGITFTTDYEFSNLNPRVNPAYRPVIQLSLEQPLLQGFGVGMNQLREAHPGSVRSPIPVPVGGRVPGILIARLFADEALIDFERRVQDLLFAVEEAYWELYAAYWDLYSREIGLRQAHAAWQRSEARFRAGTIPEQDLAQIEDQFHNFRAQRLAALGRGTIRLGVLEAERRLRYVLGLPPEDGQRLVPADVPTTAPFKPDYYAAYAEALTRRPELILARQEIQAAQLQVLRQQNDLLPDLRAFGNYELLGLGSQLDGPRERSAFASLAQNDFHNWNLGLLLRAQLGFRDAHSQVTRAQLQLAQRVAFLVDQEQKLAFNLQRSYQDLAQFYKQIEVQRARRLAATRLLRLRLEELQAGRSTIDILLEAQRNWADALRDEHFAIADYNIALIDFERQKGTILEYCNVSIAQGPLPTCVQTCASEHVRERARSLRLADPTGEFFLDQLLDGWFVPRPTVQPVPVPQALSEAAQLPPAPEVLPAPRLDPPATLRSEP